VFEDRTTTTENICRYEGIERYLCFSWFCCFNFTCENLFNISCIAYSVKLIFTRKQSVSYEHYQ
jgi:hypothetical protein